MTPRWLSQLNVWHLFLAQVLISRLWVWVPELGSEQGMEPTFKKCWGACVVKLSIWFLVLAQVVTPGSWDGAHVGLCTQQGVAWNSLSPSGPLPLSMINKKILKKNRIVEFPVWKFKPAGTISFLFSSVEVCPLGTLWVATIHGHSHCFQGWGTRGRFGPCKGLK